MDVSTLLPKRPDSIPHYTVIICVFACATVPKYKDQLLKIKETWYKRALEKNMLVLFFLGEEPVPDMVGDEYVYLQGVANDYASASIKQNLGIKYIVENSLESTYQYDYIHVCGSDTFVWIDHLDTFCKHIREIAPPNENIAIGGSGEYRMIDPDVHTYFMSGGPGFLLSNTCSKMLYPYVEDMFDMWIKKCKEVGREWLIAACDVAISYYLQTITHTKILQYDEQFVHFEYSGTTPPYRFDDLVSEICSQQETTIGSNCCAMVACHPVTLSEFDRLHDLVHVQEF
jgi:hypothetical protein